MRLRILCTIIRVQYDMYCEDKVLYITYVGIYYVHNCYTRYLNRTISRQYIRVSCVHNSCCIIVMHACIVLCTFSIMVLLRNTGYAGMLLCYYTYTV